MITIIPFEDRYTLDFKHLNFEWLRKFFAIEPYDEYQLSRPRQEIIDKGGYIFLVRTGEEIVGTVALMKESNHSFELTKMSVTQKSQGKGISKLLMNTCVATAKEKLWERIFLYSNTSLEPAVKLYRKYGFREIPLEAGSQYTRTNIKMELKFNQINATARGNN
jgi:ribosomal protein S18 acetylase RimI-like enzyme